MENLFLVLLGKVFGLVIKLLKLGSGSTWPGHVALLINDDFVEEILYKNSLKIVVIAGTNGKTTTSKLIKHILEEAGFKVLHNKSGANLENGLASTLINGTDLNLKINYDYLIFESDESALPLILERIEPHFLILLNLFRDQLDRYGELDVIIKKWTKSISKLSQNTRLILNADDPQVSYLSANTKAKVHYFGLDLPSKKIIIHGADSIFCPKCNTKLVFEKVYYSHLGIWGCLNCGLKRNKPEAVSYPVALEGLYNQYNSRAASLFAKLNSISKKTIDKAVKNFTPAFGRQEKIALNNKFVQIFLSKNPTSFNESLDTISAHKPKNLLIVLNDRVPDGLDVSWIWDTDIEDNIKPYTKVYVTGDRAWDINLRLKYAGLKNIYPFGDLSEALRKSIESLNDGEILYALPNYSAMLELRNILVGRKIL